MAAVLHKTVAAVVVVEIVVVVGVVDNTGEVAGDFAGDSIVVVVVPVIVVDDACSPTQNSWNDSRQVLLVLVLVAVDRIRIRMDVVERLHKRFVLTFVDAVDDVGAGVHETLHQWHGYCSCYCYYRESLVLSSV